MTPTRQPERRLRRVCSADRRLPAWRLGWRPSCITRGPFLRFDLVAGVTVGAVAVPSSLAMAELAGVPVVYGLYGTFLPLAVYGLLGYVAAARDRARLHAGRVDGGDGRADGDGRR